jgi:nucleotide-binding universal stress UspA family protein
MALRGLAPRRLGPVARGYRRLLVPVLDNPESQRAVETACRLAAERHASITAVTVIEVPSLLPLDAHMGEEEADARRLLDRAEAVADAHGVTVLLRTVRARDAGTAIVDLIERGDIEIAVVGAARRIRSNKRSPVFGRTVQHVLKRAGCRVLVVAAAPLRPVGG